MNLTLPRELNPGQPARAEAVNANFNAILEYLESYNEGSLNKDFSNLTEESLATLRGYFSIRNIGEIIYSPIPLTDSCLHLADGSVIDGNGTYSSFVNYIKKLYVKNSEANYFVTEEEWSRSINMYGECGKFVYNEDENTVRLPKLKGIIQCTTEENDLGDIVEAGLPNITGAITSVSVNPSGSGAFSNGSGIAQAIWSTGNASYSRNISFDASRSSDIFGNSETVQPQTVKYFVYICISTSIKTDIQADVDKITSDLNLKADIDLNNINAGRNFKNKIMNWSAPDYANKISRSLNTTYTAGSDGYLICRADGASTGAMITINDMLVGTSGIGTSWYCITNAPVAKGDKYSFSKSNGTFIYAYFIPMKGVI